MPYCWSIEYTIPIPIAYSLRKYQSFNRKRARLKHLTAISHRWLLIFPEWNDQFRSICERENHSLRRSWIHSLTLAHGIVTHNKNETTISYIDWESHARVARKCYLFVLHGLDRQNIYFDVAPNIAFVLQMSKDKRWAMSQRYGTPYVAQSILSRMLLECKWICYWRHWRLISLRDTICVCACRSCTHRKWHIKHRCVQYCCIQRNRKKKLSTFAAWISSELIVLTSFSFFLFAIRVQVNREFMGGASFPFDGSTFTLWRRRCTK